MPLILADYARIYFKLDKYKPTREEVERYVEEVESYQQMKPRQYNMKASEVRKIIQNCPVCINGEPTEKEEVKTYRDLKRINHNRIRGGMCLVASEGIALKASKLLYFAETMGLDWSWMQNIIKAEKSQSSDEDIRPNYKFLDSLAAGRPIFSYPSRIGGFRLRYGRTRGTGIMSKGIHPATMSVLDEFIATASQIKVERPGKSASITPCDSIEGPIVKLNDQSVLKIDSREKADEIKKEIKEILFLGDILICFGDFNYSKHPLIKAGYNEEQWMQELKEKEIKSEKKISFDFALSLCKEKKVVLHPDYLFYFKALSKNDLIDLIKIEKEKKDGEFLIENNKVVKRALELIGLPHSLKEKIVIKGDDALAFDLFFNQEKEKSLKIIEEKNNVHEALSEITGVDVRDKGGSFIGARLGRPETAKPREMTANPHSLFPIGESGGNTRSVEKACEGEENGRVVECDLAVIKCRKCKKMLEQHYCFDCKEKGSQLFSCSVCHKVSENKICGTCNKMSYGFQKRKINLNELMRRAANNLKIEIPKNLKAVKGLISDDKLPEALEKGMLRAINELHVFKDGTIRFEVINASLTHFKPKEIGITVEKAKELGYKYDLKGKELVDDEQLIELMPQDIIIYEGAKDYLFAISKFIDDELEKFYGLEKHYNYQNKQELIGTIVLGLAPHTSAAVVSRIIGFTSARCCFAHPYYHQAKRRNCDGDQDSIMFLMDALLNFSPKYLPDRRGSRMDAPLVFSIQINPEEVDQEIYNMDIVKEYDADFYRKADKNAKTSQVNIRTVGDKVKEKEKHLGFEFTHELNDINEGPSFSKYVVLGSMEDKLMEQAELQKKIRAVETADSIERVINSHLIPDLIGNIRKFGKQGFRCSKCSEKYRRLPLKAGCHVCGNNKIILTISEGSATKYLPLIKKLNEKYDLSHYLKQRVELIEEEAESLFKSDKVKQASLSQFV